MNGRFRSVCLRGLVYKRLFLRVNLGKRASSLDDLDGPQEHQSCKDECVSPVCGT
jgi:hypothetical protein